MNNSEKIITLTTDFGYRDPFVGQMKGVILSINPSVKIVDITHEITSQDIETAAFVIGESFQYFPEGTIHVVIVDPGVGSQRRALVVLTEGHCFLAPDNGVLSYVIKKMKFKAFCIENEKYILKKQSPTFQARDIFAPAAGWLSKGVQAKEFGKEVKDPFLFEIKEPVLKGNKIIGSIIYIDKFGNCITNIKIQKEALKNVKIGNALLPVVSFYAELQDKVGALINSNGFVEIFIYKGSAADVLNLKKGDVVEVTLNG